MIDRREEILVRLLALLGTVELDGYAVENVFRNRGVFPEDKRPAIALLDGSEDVALSGAPKSSRQSGPVPYLMSLKPFIHVALLRREITKADELGPELSAFRRGIIAAVFYDSQLLDLVTTNGVIEYLGSQTDMESGSAMQGELRLDFAFRYPLNPMDLLT